MRALCRSSVRRAEKEVFPRGKCAAGKRGHGRYGEGDRDRCAEEDAPYLLFPYRTRCYDRRGKRFSRFDTERRLSFAEIGSGLYRAGKSAFKCAFGHYESGVDFRARRLGNAARKRSDSLSRSDRFGAKGYLRFKHR